MRKCSTFVALLVFVFQSCFAQALTTDPALKPQPQHAKAARWTSQVLSNYHYRPLKLNDSSSNQIFEKYLESLDSEHLFFLASDIAQFNYARTQLDNALLEENLAIPFQIFNLYKQRVAQRIHYVQSLLQKPFNFTLDESYQYEREDVPWAESDSVLNEVWRKRVKNDWLRLKLAGKPKSEIIKTLTKRYNNSLSSIQKIKSDDVFQSFMNAYATSIDPHTNYFGVRAAEDFNISMRLSLVGIGAVLQAKDEYTVIKELVTGGPASLSGLLKVGDRIIGVSQGKAAPMVDVIGWRLDDTVDLIRGEKDSTVVLEILPAETGLNGITKRIALVRQKINLEQQAAKKSIIELNDQETTKKIGVISLPVFYQDFYARRNGDKNYKSASRDVKRLIKELRAEKVDSLLIDLRNNGGGSLDEAIALTGLFIDHGPVLQERDVEGGIKIDSDNDIGVAWDGPLGVLINRGSASASEIFAAAIQDYGRGLILGELSYGKGTVQTVINLDQIAKNNTPKFGEVKMTVAQFFRVNGGTTQLRGVTPDINLPSLNDLDVFGESSYDNALPWVQITPAPFEKLHNFNTILPTLKSMHENRMAHNKEFQLLNEDIQEITVKRNKKTITLNEAARLVERKKQEAKIAKREKITKDQHLQNPRLLPDDGLLANERSIENDEDEDKSVDLLLNEAAHILSDAVTLIKQVSSHRLVSGQPR